MVKNYIDLVDWIRINVPTSKYEGTPEKAALWFCACQDAPSFLELDIKDMAHTLIDGVNPYSSADCDYYFEVQYEDVEEEDGWGYVEDQLRHHFGLDKP